MAGVWRHPTQMSWPSAAATTTLPWATAGKDVTGISTAALAPANARGQKVWLTTAVGSRPGPSSSVNNGRRRRHAGRADAVKPVNASSKARNASKAGAMGRVPAVHITRPMSVFVKSSPLNRRGSPDTRASA